LSGVSIQQIADAAEVSKANVFHHFATKKDLYRAVLEAAAIEFRELLSQLNQQTSAQGLNEFQQQHLNRMLQDPGTTWLFLRALSDPQAGGMQRRLAEEVVGESMRAVIQAIEKLRPAGLLPAQSEASTLALTLLGANLIYFQLQNIFAQLGEYPLLQNPAAYAESVISLLTNTSESTHTHRRKATPA